MAIRQLPRSDLVLRLYHEWRKITLKIPIAERRSDGANLRCPGQAPFESQFEIAFLMAAAPLGSNLAPLSVQKLTEIRKSQLLLLNQKKLSSSELMGWQESIIAAGHFDAYNYWLFQSARPDEFNQWAKEHQAQYQAWLDWLAKNKFMVQTPDLLASLPHTWSALKAHESSDKRYRQLAKSAPRKTLDSGGCNCRPACLSVKAR
jgi:hypothetical protein